LKDEVLQKLGEASQTTLKFQGNYLTITGTHHNVELTKVMVDVIAYNLNPIIPDQSLKFVSSIFISCNRNYIYILTCHVLLNAVVVTVLHPLCIAGIAAVLYHILQLAQIAFVINFISSCSHSSRLKHF